MLLRLLIILLLYALQPTRAFLRLMEDASSKQYATVNAFSIPSSFSTNKFSATVIPVEFDTTTKMCRVKTNFAKINSSAITAPPNSSLGHRALFLVNAMNSKLGGCRSYRNTVDGIAQVVVPSLLSDISQVVLLAYGKDPHYYDAAGPFIYVGDVADGMAIEPAGGTYLMQVFNSTKTFPLVYVEQEPGEWNEFIVSIGFVATRWIYIVLLILLIFFTIYRLVKLRHGLLRRRRLITNLTSITAIESLSDGYWAEFKLLWSDPFFKLYLLQITLVASSIPTLNERARPAYLQIVAAIAWTLVQLVACGFYIAWGVLVNRIRPMVRYRVLVIITQAVVCVSLIGLVFLVLGATISTLLSFYDIGVLIGFAGTSILLLLIQIFQLVLSIGFVNYLKRHRIQKSIIVQFQRMVWIGIVFLIAVLLRLVGAVLYTISSTTLQYVLMLMITRTSSIIMVTCTLVVPNTVDISWGVQEERRIRQYKPTGPSIPGHRTILNWLKTTIFEESEGAYPLTSMNDQDQIIQGSQNATTSLHSTQLHA